jgi:hypothetical protein
VTQIEWLRKQKKRIEEVADKLARTTMSSAHSQEQYLQNVGAYRAYKILIQNFQTLIEKTQGDPGDYEPLEVSDEDDDFEPPVPRGRSAPVSRQRRPREWGG